MTVPDLPLNRPSPTVRAVLAIALAIFAGAPARSYALEGEPRPVTLREALMIAAEQSPELAAARAQQAIAQAQVRKAWGAWKPELTATGSLVHTSAPAVIDFGDMLLLFGAVYGMQPANPGFIPPPLEIIGENSIYGTLQFTQPLFTPQGLFLIAPARAGVEAAEKGALEAREQVLLNVGRTWLGLKGIDDLLKAARDAERVATAREVDARNQIRAGTAVELALLRAQTETANARVQIANLEGQRQALLEMLEALTNASIRPADGPVDSLPTRIEDEASEPWRNSFRVLAAKAQVRAAEGMVRYDRFAWLPTVAAVAKGSYNSNTGFTGKTAYYDLILNVSVPLYDRGMRYAALEEDEAKLRAARAALRSAENQARAGWMAARANLQAAEAALAHAESQAELARRAQVQVESTVRAGVTTGLELSDADTRRFLAESAAAQARAMVEIRRLELAAAEGRLFAAVESETHAP